MIPPTSMFSFLGKLPASDSVSGTLNGLDIQKTLRLAFVVFIGAFCSSVAAAGDLTSMDLVSVVRDAGSAGFMALGSASVELIRRLVVSN